MTLSQFTLIGLLSVLILSACEDEGSTLYVALITDVVPGVEFTELRVELGERQQMRSVRAGDGFVHGIRVAEFDGLAPGEHTGRVVLESRTGDRVAARPFSVLIRSGQQTGTVVISRECFGVTCPGSGDQTATACLAGRCVDPRCSPETPAHCPFSDCVADGECPAAATCAEASCVSGVCLYAGEDGACEEASYCDPDLGCQPLAVTGDVGSADAGTASDASVDVPIDVPSDAGCECMDGMTETVACGRGCASGLRTCGVDCQWQPPECDEPVGPISCWLWSTAGGGWRSYPEPTGGANEPTLEIVAAFDVEAMGEAYLLTRTSYHVLRLSDQAWLSSGPLTTLLPGLDGPPAYAMSIPATRSGTGQERLELVTTTGELFLFDHRTGTRQWTDAGGQASCCDSAAWLAASAPAFETIQAAWFDATNARSIYNNVADPLCPAAVGYSGDIAFATFLAGEGSMLHQLESQNCFEFAPPWDPESNNPFGGTRVGPGGPDPRPEATSAAFYHESNSTVWVITP